MVSKEDLQSEVDNIDINEDMSCCAIREISGIHDVSCFGAILAIARHRFEDDEPRVRPFYIFSCSIEMQDGERLTRYIQRNKLGSVVKSKVLRNDNSKNLVQVWLWSVDKENFYQWWLKKRDLLQEDDYY